MVSDHAPPTAIIEGRFPQQLGVANGPEDAEPHGHHEKIFNEPYKETQLTLKALHAHCLGVTGWVSPDAKAWVAASSRVVAGLRQRPAGT